MKTVFFGTPEFAVPPLQALMGSGHDVIAVVTQPDRRKGRGKHFSSSPVKAEAEKQGVKVLQPEKVKDRSFIDELRELKPEAIILVAYGQILPNEIIHLPEYGCINVHASLLPKYRGASPINRAIIDGEKKTGITTMLMDEGMDTGPILLQKEIDIDPDDTAGSLSIKLAEAGSRLLLRTLEGIEKNTLTPVPQPEGASYAPLLSKTDGFIPWEKSAEVICNFIRGMTPWPAAYGFLEGERIKILKALPCDKDGERGLITAIEKNTIVVGAGQGSISILEIQPAGKPAMSAGAFIRGRDMKEGMRFSISND